MTCGELMTKNPQCCLPSDSAVRAAKLMKIEDVGALPVCGAQGSRRLVGIITDRDLTLHVIAEGRDPNNVLVENVMSREVQTCRTDEDIQSALERMESRQVRRIPVVDRDGNLVGIIAQADVARTVSGDRTAEMLSQVSQP
jgi:CBS domain-containing protein